MRTVVDTQWFVVSPDDDERVDAILTQVSFQTRSDERAVYILAVDGFGRLRSRSGLDRIAG